MTSKDTNQGEGDRASARRYDKHAQEFVASGNVEPAAEQAKAYVEREPAAAAAAEAKARKGPHPSRLPSLEHLVAMGRSIVARLYARFHH
ncbi:MAG TPA: hypothetical protein VGL61_30835 [Kofleriaceae bacterium]|jgi:hypothetical protein